MPKKTKTEITIVLDRSGSMDSIASDTIGGFNTFVRDQRKVPGKCWLSLLQFDNEIDLVYDGVPIAEVPKLTDKTFIPRGATALRDAMARGAAHLQARASGKKRLRHLVVMTDGQENYSREITPEALRAMITAKRADGWLVQFIGAGEDAVDVGVSMGVDADHAAVYLATAGTAKAAFGATSRAAKIFRSGGGTSNAAYTADERASMKSE